MKNFAKKLTSDVNDLKKLCEDLHKPFAGAFDRDPFGVIADEINKDHANDNLF